MLLVSTYVAPSVIEGLGLFAAEPIAKGTPLWRFDPLLDIVIPEPILDRYPPAVRAFLARYSYRPSETAGYRVLDGDNGRFMNHSEAPNTRNLEETSVALRDIAEGEEITCDYGDFVAGFAPGAFDEG